MESCDNLWFLSTVAVRDTISHKDYIKSVTPQDDQCALQDLIKVLSLIFTSESIWHDETVLGLIQWHGNIQVCKPTYHTLILQEYIVLSCINKLAYFRVG